jgi:hypothetical protein
LTLTDSSLSPEMAEARYSEGIRIAQTKLAASKTANTSRRRLPVTKKEKYKDVAGVRNRGKKHDCLTSKLKECIIGMLQVWKLLTAIAIQTLQEHIDMQHAMSVERKSSIPIIARKRPATAIASAIDTRTMDTVPQTAALTPSTQSGGSQAMLVQMPQPGTIGAPWFTGTNVSDFLSEFDSICDDAHLTDTARVSRVPRYCFPEISRYLKGMPEWEDGNWDALKAVMQKEWEAADDFQRTRTLAFLEVLKNQDREHVPTTDIRHYCRQFKQSAAYLRKVEQISEYQASTWFLQGLPRAIAVKVVHNMRLDIDKPKDMKLDDMYKCVLECCEEAVKFQRMYKPDNSEAMEALVKKFPTRPVVLDPNSADVWRPATLLPGTSQERLAGRESNPSQGNQITQQRDKDYEDMLLDKMSKLSIRNVRAELAREREATWTARDFPARGREIRPRSQ